MRFKQRNLRAIAEMVIGDQVYFPYRSSRCITQFFEECDLGFVHDGSTRWAWTADRLAELLLEPQPTPHAGARQMSWIPDRDWMAQQHSAPDHSPRVMYAARPSAGARAL